MMTERTSILKPTFTENSPEVIQLYMSNSKIRAVAGISRNWKKMARDARKEKNRARQATQATKVLEVLLPKELLMTHPSAGKNGISHI